MRVVERNTMTAEMTAKVVVWLVRWAMDDGRWAMGDGRWAMGDGRWAMGDGRWSMVDGRWSMVDGRWSMVGLELGVAACAAERVTTALKAR